MYFQGGFLASVVLHLAVLGGIYGWSVVRPEFLGLSGGGGGGNGGAVTYAVTFIPDLNQSSKEPESPQREVVAPTTPQSDPATQKVPAQPKVPERPEISLSAKVAVKTVPLKKVLERRMPPVVAPAAPQPGSQSSPSVDSSVSGSDSPGNGVGGAMGPGPLALAAGSGGGIGGAGDGPTVLRAPKPTYPPLARRANFEGRVILDILIATDGSVADANVVRSSGREDCDESARDTIVSRWRFRPARINGISVPWRERVAVAYDLK